MKERCLLLASTLKTPVTIAAFQQRVREVADGTSPHCYDTLKLTFGGAIDAIKQRYVSEGSDAEVPGAQGLRECINPRHGRWKRLSKLWEGSLVCSKKDDVSSTE